jgi:hypothetical protein
MMNYPFLFGKRFSQKESIYFLAQVKIKILVGMGRMQNFSIAELGVGLCQHFFLSVTQFA